MDWTEQWARTQAWAYRIAGFLMLTVIDDPAWMAMLFC